MQIDNETKAAFQVMHREHGKMTLFRSVVFLFALMILKLLVPGVVGAVAGFTISCVAILAIAIHFYQGYRIAVGRYGTTEKEVREFLGWIHRHSEK